jgi:hypothetical protein
MATIARRRPVWLAAKVFADLDIPLAVENVDSPNGKSELLKSRTLAGADVAARRLRIGMTGPKRPTYRIYISLPQASQPTERAATVQTTFVRWDETSAHSADRIPCGRPAVRGELSRSNRQELGK